MTNPLTEGGPEKVAAYLREVLQCHPVYQAGQILEMRRRALGLATSETSAAPAAVDQAALRERTRRQLRKLQSEFWRTPADQLARSLNAVNVKRMPEFGPLITRLKIAASCRQEFQNLLKRRQLDTHLITALRAALVLPPEEAAAARERFLYSIQSPQRLAAAQNTARTIQKEYPILFQAERDWLTTLARMKKSSLRKRGEAGAGFDPTEIPWFVYVGAFVLLRILFQFLQ